MDKPPSGHQINVSSVIQYTSDSIDRILIYQDMCWDFPVDISLSLLAICAWQEALWDFHVLFFKDYDFEEGTDKMVKALVPSQVSLFIDIPQLAHVYLEKKEGKIGKVIWVIGRNLC